MGDTMTVRGKRKNGVQEQIKELILERGLSAGDSMPTETELMELLGISRNSVREALKALQAVGIVEIRHGFGTYVGRMSLGALVDELSFHGRLAPTGDSRSITELIEVRQALESGLIGQVVEIADAGDLADLRAVAERMAREAEAGEVSPLTDRQFHETLYRPLGNDLMLRLLAAFWDAYDRLAADLPPIGESAPDVAAQHREVYEAVASRDAERARRAVTVHFTGIRNRAPGGGPTIP
ncbi:FadR family transcriptional regulator (plasmid) [Embleya sp. NBC_00888]|uniref:FadR/GntR family transcriptional regulator n=1 Tax=Embleya sp. NBC_00888 TaxID=2975960 RepID=UPI002F91773E|nr:FadR family transcriptional regulator [Embleya sp. NBC_00888]